MSIELLPPDPVYPNACHVRSNFCRCHPETCCCNDWAVHGPDEVKHSTHFDRGDADEVVAALVGKSPDGAPAQAQPDSNSVEFDRIEAPAQCASPTLANLASLTRYTFPAGIAQGSEPMAGARGNYFSVSDVIGLFSATVAELNSARAVAVAGPAQGVALTDAQIHEIAGECGMYEQHDNARPNASVVEDFARNLLAQAKPAEASRQMVGADDVRDAARLYQAVPRGIGLDWTPGCMCCGGAHGLHNNVSFFVPSRETGEAIVSLFKFGAFLDWRESEPNWVQVKVGACDAHCDALRHMADAVRDGPQQGTKTCISLAIIDAAIAAIGSAK